MVSWLQVMYLWLGFSSEAVRLLIREQKLDIPDRLRVLIYNNVDEIYDVMRKPGSKNTDRTPNREWQVSVIA